MKKYQHFLAVGIAVLAGFYPLSPACADTSSRMLRLHCDPASSEIQLEPFLLWNGEFVHKGVALNAPETHAIQTKGADRFYYIENVYDAKDLSLRCDLPDRHVVMHLMNGLLTIEDSQRISTKHFIDLIKNTNGAWSVYGPTFYVKSDTHKKWQACGGNVEKNEESCTDLDTIKE